MFSYFTIYSICLFDLRYAARVANTLKVLEGKKGLQLTALTKHTGSYAHAVII